MKPSEDIKSISYFKAHTSEIARGISQNRGTLIITQNGEARLIVQDVASYEQTQDSLSLLKMLAISSKHVNQGKVTPARKAFERIAARVHEKAT
jgi:PHD/YefM family antitoxin component YafN of YafNO toxin-antitoxin module